MPVKSCKNPTCDRRAGQKSYCSRACQLAMRTLSKGKQIPDLWVPMSVWHRLVEIADAEGWSVRDLCRVAVIEESEVGRR